ncbi:MAG: mechanosensitive ion channel family protein [bacterium]
MSNITQILSYNFYGNILLDYVLALFVFAVSFFVLKMIKHIAINKFKKIGNIIKANFYHLFVDFIDSIGWFFYVFLSLYFAFQFIKLSSGIEKFVSYSTFIIIAYYTVKVIGALLDYSANKITAVRQEEGGIVLFINKIIKMVIWLVAILIVLQNFGYNVTSLLAGVGIGGIAIAVALQNVLSDIFAAFSIYFDKPFQVGDFIVLGDDMGTVKNIGIKSTRLRTLEGQELIVPNKELTETRVHNYKRMEKRRIAFGFGLTYETSSDKLEEVPKIIKSIFGGIDNVELDRVHFAKFNDFSLDFEVVYYLKSREYNLYMDAQQKINLAIKARFEKEDIDMAYPTQTVYVRK